jgi:hypothetical protein
VLDGHHTLADDVILIVVAGGQRRAERSQANREAAAADLIARIIPPDREVWIASTRSSAPGDGALRPHRDQGCEQDQ